MIASYLHNFIFIKTRKTAGTTIEIVLAPFCGPRDIITPIGRSEELLRGNGQPLCRNFASNRADEEVVRQAMLQKQVARSGARAAVDRFEFINHMTARRIKAHVPADFWNSAYKFTAERHPYEKAVSLAYYSHRPQKTGATFEQHLDSVVCSGTYASSNFYIVRGKVVVDEFIRHETFHDDLRRVGARLGLAIPDELPRAKTTTREDRRPAREILTDAQKETVFGFCQREFELLGYER